MSLCSLGTNGAGFLALNPYRFNNHNNEQGWWLDNHRKVIKINKFKIDTKL